MQNLVSVGLLVRYRETSKFFPILLHLKVVTPRAGPNLTPGL